MRNTVRSLAALLRSRSIQPASPDLAERIIRKVKRIQQRTQTKPDRTPLFRKKQLRRKKIHEKNREVPQLGLFSFHGAPDRVTACVFEVCSIKLGRPPVPPL